MARGLVSFAAVARVTAWAKRTVTEALRLLPMLSGLVQDSIRSRGSLRCVEHGRELCSPERSQLRSVPRHGKRGLLLEKRPHVGSVRRTHDDSFAGRWHASWQAPGAVERLAAGHGEHRPAPEVENPGNASPHHGARSGSRNRPATDPPAPRTIAQAVPACARSAASGLSMPRRPSCELHRAPQRSARVDPR